MRSDRFALRLSHGEARPVRKEPRTRAEREPGGCLARRYDQRKRRRGRCGDKQNGAGITADPTLTDAWSRRNGHLASGGFPSAHRSARAGSVAGARTGIRKHPPVLSPGRSGANPFAGLSGKTLDRHFRNRTSLVAGAVNFGFASDRRSSTKPPRASDRSARPVMKRLALVRHRSPGAADRSPCTRQSRGRRGQVSPRLSGLDLSGNFRPFGLQLPGVSAPFRWIETALRAAFRQALGARLIHRRSFSLWTRVDKSTLRRKDHHCAIRIETFLPGSADPPQRSRCASSLRRKALSLMNPSASFWS